MSKPPQIVSQFAPNHTKLSINGDEIRRFARHKSVQRVLTGITLLAAFSTPVAAQPPGLVVSVAASMSRRARRDRRPVSCSDGRDCRPQRRRLQYPRAPDRRRRAGRPLPQRRRTCRWMWSRRPGRIVPGTRTRLLTNELAVVVPPDAPADFTLERLLEGRVVATRDGRAGRCARRCLWPPLARDAEGVGTRCRRRSSRFPTVRAVLSAVEAGRVDAGIVYRTDAMPHQRCAWSRASRRKIIRISISCIPRR